MDKKINLSQLADLLAQAGGMSKAASEQFVKSFFDIISQGVLSEGLVKVKGLGTFKLLQMEDRESVNVNTGERFTIEGHQKISFSPDAELKERINKPFSAFETVEITAEQAAELSKLDESVNDSKETPEPEETAAIVAAESAKEQKTETESQPEVKEVTQKRFTRFILKLLIWILAIALVVPVLLYLFWPLVGCQILGYIDNRMGKKQPAVTTVETPKDSLKVTEIEQPAETVKPAAPVEPAKPVQATQATATIRPVKLTPADEAKDLSLFTTADTVNYRITGELATHVLKKGETLTKVALDYYGSKKLWPYIAKYNKNLKNFNNLKVGDKIRVPKLEGK